jgi:hypothetical protein
MSQGKNKFNAYLSSEVKSKQNRLSIESDIRRTQDFSLNVSTVELCENAWSEKLDFLLSKKQTYKFSTGLIVRNQSDFICVFFVHAVLFGPSSCAKCF